MPLKDATDHGLTPLDIRYVNITEETVQMVDQRGKFENGTWDLQKMRDSLYADIEALLKVETILDFHLN